MSETANIVAGIVERAMRREGFIGRVHVTHVRTTKSGHTARVQAYVGGHVATYRARLAGDRVTVTQTAAPRRVAGVPAA